ncbi:hypothetical protein JOM56_013706 [Amanita muscaria]
MSEMFQLLTTTLRDLGQDSEVNEAIALLREIHADARYTHLVVEVDDPALQRPRGSPASRNSAPPPIFGPNSPRYVLSSPTTVPPFAPLVLEDFSPPHSLSPLPLPLPSFFRPPVVFTVTTDVIPDTPSTAISASPHASPTSDTFATDEPNLRINYNIPIHYYPSQQENDSGKRAKLTTTGLWTLDFSSCYGWRHDKNTHIIYSSHIFTARLEQHFVDSYRLKFLKDCPAAAHLRKRLANELSQFCSIAPVRFKDQVTGLTGIQNPRKFFFPDGIKVPALAAKLINTIDVQSLLDNLMVQKRSWAWLTEATSALAHFEKLECLASVPGGDQLDPMICNHITQLIQAIEINVAHLGKIDNALQEDPNTAISPFLSRFEPSLEEIPSIEYARRPAFTPSDVRKLFGNDPSPSETNDLDNNHDENMEDELVQTVNPPPTAPSSQTTDLPMDIDVSVQLFNALLVT